MSNTNVLSHKYFESYANEIQSKFQRIRELTDHPGASGDYHEEILRSMLRNFLTKRFSVKTGFVYKDTEHVSRQVDILIIDENAPATYLFQDEQFAIVTPESVVAAIEVKTTMNTSQFKQSMENLASVKEQFDNPAHVTTLAFGYAGVKGNHATLDKWFTSVEIRNTGHLPDGFMLFNAAKLLLRYDNHFKDGEKFREFYSNESNQENSLGWQLSVFIATIMTACESRDNRGPVIQLNKESVAQRLIQAEGGEASWNTYMFGKGIQSPNGLDERVDELLQNKKRKGLAK